MLESVKKFIKKVQNTEDRVKRNWVFALSGTTMAITVALWLVYVNLTVKNVSPAAEKVKTETAKKTGFISTFGAGLSQIAAQIKSKLSVKNNIFINRPNINFQLEGLEEIKRTKLP
ncbi:MAG: hypothetical protein AAB646_01010 [Patescibacteria group bacterium]